MSTWMNRLALGAIVVAPALVAQPAKRVANPKLPVRETIADAEAEGAAYPHGPAREHGPTLFAGRGPVGRKCTNGPATNSSPSEIQSGDFVIG